MLDRLDRLVTQEDVDGGNTCDVVPVMLAVSPPRKYSSRCNTTQVLTFGCRGTCSSYVRVKEENVHEINRMCR